jgi:hypothetical protein
MTDEPDAPSLDLRNTKARLKKIGVSAAISAVFTFFTMRAILSGNEKPNTDPVGAGSVWMLGIAIFVVLTLFSHSILSRKAPKPMGLKRSS